MQTSRVILGSRLTLAAALAFAAIASLSAPALAAEMDTVVSALRESRVYVEEGSDVDPAEARAAVNRVVTEEDLDLRFAALAAEPANGSDSFARRLLRRAGGEAVLVLTPESLGFWSRSPDRDAREAAADAAVPFFQSDDVAGGIEAFGSTLGSSSVPEEAPFDDGDAGLDSTPDFPVSSVPGPGVLIVLGLLAIGGVALFNASRSTRRIATNRVDEARTEVRHQINVMAERILAISDQVTIGSEQAQAAYAEATTLFREVSEGYAAATTEAQLRQLNDKLDRARWQLDVTTAVLEGREPPQETVAGIGSCFFDPDHGAGIHDATLQTAAGDRQVGVCDYCAAKLARGEAPAPRQVRVNGKQVPAGMAPREYGGGGFSGLDTFTILFGGGRPLPYSWGRPRYRRSGWGGGFGGGGFGGGFGGGGGAGRRGLGGGGLGGGGRRGFGGGGGGRGLGGGGGGRRKL